MTIQLHRSVSLIAAAVIVVLPCAASATIFEVEATGTIDASRFENVEPGDTLRFSLSIATETGCRLNFTRECFYRAVDGSATIAGLELQFGATEWSSLELSIVNDRLDGIGPGDGNPDGVRFSAFRELGQPVPGTDQIERVEFELFDTSGTVFSSFALDNLLGLELGVFEVNSVAILEEGTLSTPQTEDGFISARIDSFSVTVIPLPSGVLLLGSAIAALMARSRSRYSAKRLRPRLAGHLSRSPLTDWRYRGSA